MTGFLSLPFSTGTHSAPTRPVLRYHGGKFRLAPWIVQFFPQHSLYVEPFGGAASVLLRKQRADCEVYNDLDSRIVNVFRVLRDPNKADELRRQIELTPYAREEFDASYAEAKNDVDAAAKTIARSFMGVGSDSATRGCRAGFRAKRAGNSLPSSEWSTWPESIQAFTSRLRGVLIENRDALEVIERYDGSSTLIYADPPYVFSTRMAGAGKSNRHGYKYELEDEDHAALAETLLQAKGYVVLSGYHSALYDDLYAGWQRFERRHVADRGKPSTECVWINDACAGALNSVGIFGGCLA